MATTTVAGGRGLTLVALTAGAAGAAVAGNGDIILHLAGEIAKACAAILSRITTGDRAGGGLKSGFPSDDAHVSELALQVQEMSKALNKLLISGGHRIALDSGSSINRVYNPSWFSILFLTSLGASGMMHLSGWKVFPFSLFDSFLVTRNTFKKGISSIGSQMEVLSHKMKHMRQMFAQKVEGLENKQSKCIKHVTELNDSVYELTDKVNDVARDVTLMGSGLGAVDIKIDDLNEKQAFANKGIYLICRAVLKQLRSKEDKTSEVLKEYYTAVDAKDLETYLSNDLFLETKKKIPERKGLNLLLPNNDDVLS